MIVIDYDSNPNNSIFYVAALVHKYATTISNDFEVVRNYCIKVVNKNELLFYYSLDWLFLLGKVKAIEGGKIVCD